MEKMPVPDSERKPTARLITDAPGFSIDQMHEKALAGESFEYAAAALTSVEQLIAFRQKLKNTRFASFSEMVEEVTNIHRLPIAEEEKDKRLHEMAAKMEPRVARFSPQVADFYLAVLSEATGKSYEPKFERTKEKVAELRDNGDFRVLFSEDVDWDLKANRIEKRFLDYLAGVRSLDRRESNEMSDDVRVWRADQLKKSTTRPRPPQKSSKPGVDPMERLKEGEKAPSIWSIFPAYRGKFREASFSIWDNANNEWLGETGVYHPSDTSPLVENTDPKNGPVNLTISATVDVGVDVRVPATYKHNFNKVEVPPGYSYVALKDQNGDLVIRVDGQGDGVDVKVVLAPDPEKTFCTLDASKVTVPIMPSVFTPETLAKLQEIKEKKRGNIARAEALSAYVRGRVKYLAPKDFAEAAHYNNHYNTSAKGFAGAVDEVKTGDCDVVNTYFAALCAALNIPVRHVVGHSVNGKDEAGASNITSGTGHAWSEVWDERKKQWRMIDATPAGDLQLEREETGGKANDFIPGDDDAPEAVTPSEEELEKLRQRLAEHKEKLSYTREERELAEGAKIALSEARQVVKEIAAAEKTRLPSGELVIDVLARLFNAIVESRKTRVQAYDGPARKRDGGERIQNIVRHAMGVRAHEADPISRELPAEETVLEKLIGGFDVYLIGDKSGSMQGRVAETEQEDDASDESDDPVSQETLQQMQRRAAYLLCSSLHRFGRDLSRAPLQEEKKLGVRTQSISFRGDGPDDIDLDKPLSPDFKATDKVLLWHSLSRQGAGNGDVEALRYVFEQIKAEIAANEAKGIKEKRLRVIVACSDGEPNDPAMVQFMAEELGKLGCVVVGVGMTKSAKKVPIIFDTPFSRGDYAESINDLPAIVAKHLVLEAIKLFPEKERENARQMINSILAKFRNIPGKENPSAPSPEKSEGDAEEEAAEREEGNEVEEADDMDGDERTEAPDDETT